MYQYATCSHMRPARCSARANAQLQADDDDNIKVRYCDENMTQTSVGCFNDVQSPPQVPSCCSAWEDCTAGRRVCCCGHWVCHLHSRRQYTDAANPITIIVCRHCPQWDYGAMFDGFQVSLKDSPDVHFATCEDVHDNMCK